MNTWIIQFALIIHYALSGMKAGYPEFKGDVWLFADVAIDTWNKEAFTKRRPTELLIQCLRIFECRVNPAISFTFEESYAKFAYIRMIRYSD